MNWRKTYWTVYGKVARVIYRFQFITRARDAERNRCIRVLCRHKLGTVTAVLHDHRLSEDWIRSLLQPFIPERR